MIDQDKQQIAMEIPLNLKGSMASNHFKNRVKNYETKGTRFQQS